MNDICTYRIEIRGQVTEAEINPRSPIQMTVEQIEPTLTLCTVRTDQSGLVGLVRHLHGLGFTILSICSNGTDPIEWERSQK